jgi:hypothetical protein
MLVIGGILFIAWGVWDGFYAKYPIMPRRVLNRTFVSHVHEPTLSIPADVQFACLFIDFFYFFSSYLVDTYFSSWTWVVTDWSVRHHPFYPRPSLITRPAITPSS